MNAVAVKKGQSRFKAPTLNIMGTVRCDGCGEEFFVGHQPGFTDPKAAERQAYWLEKVLAEEHERNHPHPDKIDLPD